MALVAGNYVTTQCDKEGNCACVDETTGAELIASRRPQPRGDVCKLERRECSIVCGEELAATCPFGVDLDHNGCPRTSQCRCRNPCDAVDCPAAELCLLRFASAREQAQASAIERERANASAAFFACKRKVFRSRDCAEDVCLPVPVSERFDVGRFHTPPSLQVCERNPCANGERPAMETRFV